MKFPMGSDSNKKNHMYPINVQTAEPIGPKLNVGHDPREGLRMNKISKISLKQNSFFIKFDNPQSFFLK